MKDGLRFVDSDMHVMEPPDLFRRYLDPKFANQRPAMVKDADSSRTNDDFRATLQDNPRRLYGFSGAARRAFVALSQYAT